MYAWIRFKRWFDATFRGPVKKEQWAWSMYDWAKSPYENAVLGVFLGPFITNLAKTHACNIVSACMWCAKEGACWSREAIDTCGEKCTKTSDWCCDEAKDGYVYIGNSPISYGSVYAYSLSASAILQVLVLPFIGAFGDSTKSPKLYLFLVTLLSSIILVLMLTVTSPSLFWLATMFAILGNVLYATVNVFYNALLINVASPKEQNFVSSLGYAVGYVGGGIVLIIALVFYLVSPGYRTIRIMMAVCGIWWLLFSMITFKRVTSTEPRRDPEEPIPSSSEQSSIADESEKSEKSDKSEKFEKSENQEISGDIESYPKPEKLGNLENAANLRQSMKPTNVDSIPALNQIVATSMEEEQGNIFKRTVVQLWRTLKLLKRVPNTLLFLIASAIFNDGISTVSSLAGTYSTEALDATFSTLAILALITNFAGIVGAFFFAWIAKKIGTKISILISLTLWCGVVIWGYLVQSISQLYFIGFLIGVGLGSSQPLSRSLLAKMIPKGYENQIFSFYELTQRGTSWIGPLVYASVTSRYHNNPRPGIITMLAFFVIGGLLLCFVNITKGIRHAKMVDEGKK